MKDINNLKNTKEVNDELCRRMKNEHEQLMSDLKFKIKYVAIGFFFGACLVLHIWGEYWIAAQ